MKTTSIALKTNTFYHLAEKYRKLVTVEEEIEKVDMTETFYRELEYMISHGEIIIININGKMRTGKSTEAIQIGKTIYDLLIKYKQRPTNTSFNINNIMRNQQEYSKLMRDAETQYTVIVVDEWDDLEEGGENSSAESALNRVFSNVQAARYVHKVACSPKETSDPNADILLSIIAPDRKNMITRNKLYYRYYEGGIERIQLLGYVDINVKDVIYNWEKKVKKVYYKPKRTPEEEEFIKNQIKEDWYVEYVVRKTEKMELITKEGIMRPRMLDYAEVIYKTIQELKPLASLQNTLNPNIIRNYIKMNMRKAKIPVSIIGEDLSTREASGTLDLYKSLHKINKDIDRHISKAQSNPTKTEIETINTLKDVRTEIVKAINVQLEELKKYTSINKKYNEKVSREQK